MSSRPRSSNRPAVAAVLRRALSLLLTKGWRSSHWENVGKSSALTIGEAIQWAGDASIACHHARTTVSALIGIVHPIWEANPWRTEEEAVALVRRAVEVSEGRAHRPHRRTGPTCSMGPVVRVVPELARIGGVA